MIPTACRAALLALLVALCVALASGVTLAHARPGPDSEATLAKQLAKLELKLAKRQAKLDAALATAADYAAQLVLADSELAVAALLPEGTPEELKAKAKALKLAQKLVTKLGKKVVKWDGKVDKHEQKLEVVKAAIELLVPGYFNSEAAEEDGDGSGGGDTILDPSMALPLLRVDCGDLDGYATTEDGYALLTETSAPEGVSLDPAALDTVHVAYFYSKDGGGVSFPSSVVALDPDQVGERHKLTSLVLADPTTLAIGGLPPDTAVRVLLELGATAPWVEFVEGAFTGINSATDSLRVEVDGPAGGAQWQTVAQNLRCGTALGSTSFQTDSGAILPLWVLGTTDGTGVLQLRLSSDADTPVLLAAFSVYLHEALPIVYRRTAAGPLRADDPDAAAFVAAFNAGDLDAAQSVALALPDDLLRGVALLHVAGWLDGSRDGRLSLLPAARVALVAAQAAGHAAASVLLDQLDHVERALAHFAARGYSAAYACAAQGGPGFLNPDCAGQIYSKLGQADTNVNFQIGVRELRGLVAGATGPTVLSDLAAWNAGALDGGGFEPSPLVFLALKQCGAQLVVMNPLLSSNSADPGSASTLTVARDVFDGFIDLGFAAADFPRDRELALFQAYLDAGENPKDWDVTELALFSEAEIADSWWASQVELLPDEADATAWANAQRDVQRLLRHFVEEWFELRLSADELGGGQGDDVEVLLQLFPLFAARNDSRDRLLRTRFDDLVHFALEESGTVLDGYWAGSISDVEHTSEYTADPVLVSRAVFGDTARTALLGGLNGRHVLDAANPAAAFAGTTAAGRTHFKSWWFTTAGPSTAPGDALDIFLNGRALVPALALAQRGSLGTSHPLVEDLRAWAAGWRDDALLDPGAAGGKPTGFPAPAQWPSNALGTAGLWYTQESLADDTGLWQSGEVSYVLGLLRAAYRQSAAADRWQFLLPAVRMFRAVADWEDAGEPSGAAGSLNWAAEGLKTGARFGLLVLDNFADLAADATLTTTTDPSLGGTTWVDSELIARMRSWLETEYTDQGPALRYALPDVGLCGVKQTKNPTILSALFENELTYLRNVWPLLCRHAMHTDRIFPGYQGVQRELLTAWTGAPMVEGQPFTPLVRWSGDDLDLAVLTNHRDAAGTTWSAFAHNFAPAPAQVTLTLDAGLQPGAYLLEYGPASYTCDVFISGAATSVMVNKPGMATAVGLTLAAGLNLVRVTRTGPVAAAEAFDLLLDPPRLVDAGGGALAVRVRVANAGLVAAPSSSLDLHVQAIDAEGATVSVASLPSEQLLNSATLALGAATGWELPEQTVTFALPAGSPLVVLLQSGFGVQLRAQITSTAAEWDPTNNGQSRCWFLADIDPDG